MTARDSILGAGDCASTLVLANLPAHAQIAVKNQGYIPYSDAPIFYRSEDINDPVDAAAEAARCRARPS